MPTAIGSYITAALLKSRQAITDSADDTVIGLVCDGINQFIETRTHRVLAPIASTTYLYDGDNSRSLYLPFPVDKAPIGGVRVASQVEVRQYTGATFAVLASTEYFLRQRVGMTGPYERLEFTDRPTTGYDCWPRGRETVRVTATAGWTTIPDDIADVAATAATKAWHAVQTGQLDIVGTTDMGAPVVSRFFSRVQLDVLDAYAAHIPA